MSKRIGTRYAIYYTPAPDSILWQLVSAWLGRDSHLNQAVDRPDALGLSLEDLTTATANPARYGFHATLVAPFELAEGLSENDLASSMAEFCRERSAFNTRLKVDRLDDFIALVPAEPDNKLDTMAAACVHHFDAFRVPLSADDLARRDSPHFNELERSLLRRWGYPHVLEAFRFHLSLTDSAAESSLERLEPALKTLLAESLEDPTKIDGLTLSKQPDRESPFHTIARHTFNPA